MIFNSTVKIALTFTLGAVLISSTLLFPLIRELNQVVTNTNSTVQPVDKEKNKTIQVISKDQNSESRIENIYQGRIDDNLSVDIKASQSMIESSKYNHDTSLKSKMLETDIPSRIGN